jgi:hypothetical protein
LTSNPSGNCKFQTVETSFGKWNILLLSALAMMSQRKGWERLGNSETEGYIASM